jgi:5-methylcytosine-specific restriction endonuclease McrA
MERLEFTPKTKELALARQKFRCASCGERITKLGEAGRSHHTFGEIGHAHHVDHAKSGGANSLDNCVVLCQSCHYSAHEGGRYRHGTVIGRRSDFPHFDG